MKHTLITVLISSCLLSGAALADDDCFDPVSEWQPREKLRQMMTDRGWDVKRIKMDDGCYEVKGLDRKGHRVEAKFSPASLKIIEMEIKFDQTGDASDYFNLGHQDTPKKSADYINSGRNTLKNKPQATIE